MADTMPPLPDDVWERALSVALDPTTPAADADLVPDMDDIPVVPDDDGEIVLDDDTDTALLDDDGGDLGALHGDIDDQDLDGAGDIDGAFFDPAVTDADITTADLPDLALGDSTFDDGPDLGGDLY
ncbi:hypothetical protein AB4Z09_26245 [Rhodococcus sp. TAF43]|uniref:hypothetical protein n=1 Tax=Rhodococcus sp. TAF43 TaxID=3237483 RepID=UPI003F9D0875